MNAFKSMKFFITAVLCLLVVPVLFSQSLDKSSLERELNRERGSSYIKKAIETGKKALGANDIELAKDFFEKAVNEIKNTKQKDAIAVVALEIADLLIKYPDQSKKTSNTIIDLLHDVQTNTTDLSSLSRVYEITQMLYSSDEKLRRNKKLNNLVSISEIAHTEYHKQKLESTAIKVQPQVIENLELEKQSLSKVVSDLKGFQGQLSTRMKENEDVIRSMTQENLIKEAILEKNKRLLDSMSYQATLDSIIIETNLAELRQKESELKLKQAERNLLLSLAGLILLVAGFLFYRFSVLRTYNKKLEEKNNIIADEKQRSEELLLNILPVDVANELKANGKVIAQYYENSTILFADFVNFSQIAKNLSPQEMVQDLDYCFSKFDAITGIHRVEKIKTIGDAYMCIAGVPTPLNNHADAAVAVAQGFVRFLKEWNIERKKKNQILFNVRIGLHSGPVSAGVVGTKKFVFDVWGDAVNIAARMESNAEPGRINISNSTYELIKSNTPCEPRGAIVTKNMGKMEMYYISKV